VIFSENGLFRYMRDRGLGLLRETEAVPVEQEVVGDHRADSARQASVELCADHVASPPRVTSA
jgi:hypothetical protein